MALLQFMVDELEKGQPKKTTTPSKGGGLLQYMADELPPEKPVVKTPPVKLPKPAPAPYAQKIEIGTKGLEMPDFTKAKTVQAPEPPPMSVYEPKAPMSVPKKPVGMPSTGLELWKKPSYRGVALPEATIELPSEEQKAQIEARGLGVEYDRAPDKWAFKQTLEPGEIEKLESVRPESKAIGSITPEEKIRQQEQYGVRMAPIEGWIITTPEKPFSFASPEVNDVANSVIQAWREYKRLLWESAGAGIEKVGKGLTTEPGIKAQLKIGAGIIDTLFSPLTAAGEQISDPNDPMSAGSMTAKLASAPFSVAHAVIRNGAELSGVDPETADDIAIIGATVAFMAKSEAARGESRGLAEYQKMANDTFTKSRDLTTEAKQVWKEGIRETHPDSWLPTSDYFVRFNRAAANGDVTQMRAIIDEAKAAKIEPTPLKTSSEIREAAQAGDPTAIAKDGIFKEEAKQSHEIVEADKKITIDTVKYDDWKVSSRITVENPEGSTTTTFSPEYPNEKIAIEKAIEEGKKIEPTLEVKPEQIIEKTAVETIEKTPTTKVSEEVQKPLEGAKEIGSKVQKTPLAEERTITEKDFWKLKELKEWVHLNDLMTRANKNLIEFKTDTGKIAYISEKLAAINSALKKVWGKSISYEDVKSVHTLDNFIEHGKLFEKYPSLKNVEVTLANFHSKKRAFVSGKSIFLNSGIFEKEPKMIYGSLVHEIQHLIQSEKWIEPEVTTPWTKEYRESKTEIEARAKQLEYYKKEEYKKWIEEMEKYIPSEETLLKSMKKGAKVWPNQGRRMATGADKALKHTFGTTGLSEFAKRETKLSDFAKREKKMTEKDLKISERVREIIDGLETRFTKYVAKGTVGLYFPDTRNIAIRTLNDMSTTQHELAHLIDHAQTITRPLYTGVALDSRGRILYGKENAPIRRELTQVYVDNYPGARKTDSLFVRVKEGYATLQQKYLENPELVKQKYPLAYEMYIENGSEMQKHVNEQFNQIVAEYQGLEPLKKIGSVVTNKLSPEENSTFLNPLEKVQQYMVNAVTLFEKLDRETGRWQKSDSVADRIHAQQSVRLRAAKNLTEIGEGFWAMDENGNMAQMVSKNYADIIKMLWDERQADNYGFYLVARDQYFNHKDLDKLADDYVKMQEEFPNPNKLQQQELDKLSRKIDDLSLELSNNEGILPRDVVEEAYLGNKDRFSEVDKIIEEIDKALLVGLKSVGKLSEEEYLRLSESQGYSPMKRAIEDMITESQTAKGLGGGKGMKIGGVSTLLKRTGGTYDIINPLYSRMQNVREIMDYVNKQAIMNNLYDALAEKPELAQRVPIDSVFIPSTGKVIRTVGGKDIKTNKDIITKMVNGEPHAMVINKQMAKVLEMVWTPIEMSPTERAFATGARIFTKGTTGTWLTFAFTNIVRDQPTAFIHSVEGYSPLELPKYSLLTAKLFARQMLMQKRYNNVVWHYMEKIAENLVNMDKPEAKYGLEYISQGGDLHTSLNWNKMSGEEIFRTIDGERKGLEKFLGYIEAGVSFLAIPGNISEIGTRMQEYVKSREAWKSTFTAFQNANNVATAFSNRGEFQYHPFARGWVSSIPYANAQIKGLGQYISTATTSKAGRNRLAWVVAAVTAAIVYNNMKMFFDSDEDDRRALLELSPQQLGSYLYHPSDTPGTLTKIPLTIETGFIGGLISMMLIDMQGGRNYTPNEYLSAITNVLPDQLQFNEPLKVALSLIPQLIKPELQVAFNKKTFPEVSDIETKAAQLLPREFRYNKGTSEFAKWFGKTGLAEELNLSPIQVDSLLESRFGRSIGYFTGKPGALDVKNPFVQKEYLTSSKILRDFFESSDKADQEAQAIKKGLREADENTKMEIYAKQKRAKEIKDKISELYKIEDQEGNEGLEAKREIWKMVQEYNDFQKSDITTDEMRAFSKKEEQAEWKKEKVDILDKYMQKYQETKGEEMAATKLERELKQEIVTDKKDKTQTSRYSSLLKEFRKRRSSEEATDPLELRVVNAKTNDDKAAILMEGKDQYTPEEFQEKLAKLRRSKAISSDVIRQINKLTQ